MQKTFLGIVEAADATERVAVVVGMEQVEDAVLMREGEYLDFKFYSIALPFLNVKSTGARISSCSSCCNIPNVETLGADL